MRDTFKKIGAISLFISPIIFFILTTIGMYLYPGGYEIDDILFRSQYYKFSKNFFSDLGLLITPTGKPNIASSILFCIGMTVVGVAFMIHAISLTSYFTKKTRQQKFALLGVISAIISSFGFILVAFTPWDVFPLLHNIGVLIGFGISTFYCLFFGLAIFKEKTYPNFYGILSMVYILVIIAYTLATVFSPPFDTFPGRTTHVLAQKVVGYIIMVLLPTQAIGSMIQIKKQE